MRIGVMLRDVARKGGVSIYTVNILKHLLRIDKDNQYILFYQGKRRKTSFSGYSNVEERWINVPYKILWDQVFIPFLALKARIDLLFSPKWTVPLLSPCRIIMVVHGTENFIHPEFYKARDILYLNFMLPIYLRRATKTIVVSNKSKDDLVKFTGVSESKLVVVHMAAEDIFSQPLELGFMEKVKTKYNLPLPFILHVGVIYPGKNIERVIQALAKLREKFPHKLVLVGGFRWKYAEIFNLIEKLKLKDKVIMIEWISHTELRVLYKLADLLLFPSFYESFGIPVLEAMACGCPVITSSSGAMPEIAGEAALLVKPTSVDEIYQATARVLEDKALRTKLVNKGFAQAKKFSWEKNARQTLSVFKELEKHYL